MIRTLPLTPRVLSAAALVLASPLIYAGEAPRSPIVIDTVPVWGTQINASSLNVSADTLAIKQADHISDLLRTIPGVDVGGAHSLNQRITIRSMDDKDLRINIDGANQNTYMYHHMGNLQINADILKAVDVEVGTNSVINGGLGGAVNFETKTANQLLRPGEQYGARLKTSWGDNSGTSQSISAYGQLNKKFDFLAYYNLVDRKNYKVGGEKIKDPDGNEIAGSNGSVKGIAGDLDDALIKLGWDITANQRLEFGYETYNDEGNYSQRPDMGLATGQGIANLLSIPLLWPTEFNRDTLTLSYKLNWAGHSKLKATAFKNDGYLKRDETGLSQSSNAGVQAGAGTRQGETESIGFNLLAESVIGDHIFTYGVDSTRYKTHYKSGLLSGSSSSSQEKSMNYAVFAQDLIQLSDKFAITPGLRYDSSNLDSALTNKRFSGFSAALAGEYELTDSLLVKLSTTQLFKAPEIGEVFVGAGTSDSANPGIKEETGLNTEISLAYEDRVLGADQFIVGITVFQTDIDDYIYDSAPNGSGRWKDNIGDMKIEGFESYIGYNIGQLSTLLTFSKAESELSATAEYAKYDKARLDREQGNTISLNIDYKLPAHDLTLHWDSLIVGDVSSHPDLNGAATDRSKDSYEVHNISARWEPVAVKNLALTVGVDNLFDEYYTSHSSRTGVSIHPVFGKLNLSDFEPGRNIKATISLEI